MQTSVFIVSTTIAGPDRWKFLRIYYNPRLKELELEKARLEIETETDERRGASTGMIAYSDLVPRELVREEAAKLGVTEGYANHVLNRTLPVLGEIRRVAPDWAVRVEKGEQK